MKRGRLAGYNASVSTTYCHPRRDRRKVRERLADPSVVAALERVPARLSSLGFDPWGFSRRRRRLVLGRGLAYRRWFRVETQGIEHVPRGRVLLNREPRGQVPWTP